MLFGMQQIQKQCWWLKNVAKYGPYTLLVIYWLQVHNMYFTNSIFCEPNETYKRIYQITQLKVLFKKVVFYYKQDFLFTLGVLQ